MEDKLEANRLSKQGYAITSRKHCMAARIDREDWRYHMAKQHASRDWMEEGMHWVNILGEIGAPDYYRRCVSKDKITVSEGVRRLMFKSGDCSYGYRSKEKKNKSHNAWQQPFSVNIWAQEAHKLCLAMMDDLTKWEDCTMEKIIKCFHFDDITFAIPSKCGEIYPESTRKYWGHVVTNKATRTDSSFALLFDPNGARINCITHAMFDKLASKMQHEYIRKVPEIDLNDFIEEIPYLSKFQAHRLVKSLVKNSPHLENYRSEYTKFKEPRFIIIDLED